MLSRTYTATTVGLTPLKIEVEVDSSRGTPSLVLIGLPTKAVEESKERITAALTNCGIRIRSRRTIVNLAPADVKKTSAIFELAIAIGILKMYGEVVIDTDSTLFFGELSLEGELKSMTGALPLVLAAKTMGFEKIVLPAANAKEVTTISGITIHPITNLNEYILHAQHNTPLPTLRAKPFSTPGNKKFEINFSDIAHQAVAKRALTIAAAGGHNTLLIGPPGTGKSMLAKAMVSILPPLTEQESLEVTTIYSVCGLNKQGLITERPFRTPHHTTSYSGLIGGGTQLKPGEISLAHRGVLFLDEFTEFNKQALETLRQPLEDRMVTITRANGSITYPASFTLIAAANPCPCGWHNSQQRECRCSRLERMRYQQRLSGPILDRIDLFLFVQPLSASQIQNTSHMIDESQATRAQVIKARKMQRGLLQETHQILNADLSSKQAHQYLSTSLAAKQMLIRAVNNLKLSARSYFRTIKVAQTIANLDGEEVIGEEHMAEALQYRYINEVITS